MNSLHHVHRKNFISSLCESNKEAMETIDLGHNVLVDSLCGSILKGQLESSEEDGIILRINKKSKAVIKSESIQKIKKT